MKTLIIGLGNPILTDDGVGVKVAYELERLLHTESGDHPPLPLSQVIDIIEASVGGLRLMEMMIGYEQAIIIDALTSSNGYGPGHIHRLTLDDLRAISPTQHSASAHDTTLVTALDSGKALGFLLPDTVTIFAVEVENVRDFNTEPTTAVAAAIPELVTAVLHELDICLKSKAGFDHKK